MTEDRARVVVGPFDETLEAVCAADGPFDLVFIDGHHEREAALRYTDTIRPFLAPGAVVVLDDVEPGRPVRAAYKALRASGDAGLWLGKWGLIVPVPNPGVRGAPAPVARPTPLPIGH